MVYKNILNFIKRFYYFKFEMCTRKKYFKIKPWKQVLIIFRVQFNFWNLNLIKPRSEIEYFNFVSSIWTKSFKRKFLLLC